MYIGTWAGGVRSSRRTVVSELRSLIDQRENVFVIPINGVGSDDSLLDWLRGGAYQHISVFTQS